LELNQKCIAYGLDFSTSMARENGTKETTMPFQRLKSGKLVLLGERSISHDVRVHDRSESPLAVWHYSPVLAEVILTIKRFVEGPNGLGGVLDTYASWNLPRANRLWQRAGTVR
jgi:hypothetical protein